METEIAKTLIETGNEKFMYIGVGLIVMQVFIVPLLAFVFKHYTSVDKKLIDAERLITKMDRDAQMAGFQKQLDEHIMQDSHKHEEMNRIFETMNKTLNDMGNKLNKIYEKVYNIE